MRTSAIATRVFPCPLLAFLIALFLIHNDGAFAQELARADNVKKDTPGRSIKPGERLRVDVDLALVNVTVTDPYYRLVTGLEPDNFRVFEDNVEQEVVKFSSEDVPISIGVIFDTSGSMSNKLDKSRQAAIQFFKTANPQDEFFMVSFNERAELVSTSRTASRICKRG